MFSGFRLAGILSAFALAAPALLCSSARADENVMLTDVPDYAWYAGCFGTAAGNLIGYWDRHGLPNLYTGPTGGGVAPLNNNTFLGNSGINSMWASQAGVDGRPATQPGHMDDYWENPSAFESTAGDPYLALGRPEHSPDCLGDFMGQSQNKWANLGGEVNGNINGYAYTFWDREGNPRKNYQPAPQGATPVRDVQSGLREFAKFRGYEADVVSQLVDFNPTLQPGKGFTFEHLKAEIDAGYPVLLILQWASQTNRALAGNSRANPAVHAMVAFGYLTSDAAGQNFVQYRTSWAYGDNFFKPWENVVWEANLPLLGVLTFRPSPKIKSMTRAGGQLKLTWDGPASVIRDNSVGENRPAHYYVVERATEAAGQFTPVSQPAPELEATIPETTDARAFYRVRLLSRAEAQ